MRNSGQRRTRRLIAGVSGAMLLGALGTGAQAAATAADRERASSTELQEVVVTARKRSEEVQRVPESISVVTSKAIEDAHITRLDDLTSLVPNLNMVTRADHTPDVVIRGVGAFGVTAGIGFYANDVQLFDGETVRPEDIERIEVLKGPQGTLYGGLNVGGAIKYVTKRPTNQLTAEATAEVGNFGQTTFSAAVSGPLVEDHLKARLSVFRADSDGFIFDPILDRTLGATAETGGRLTLEAEGGGTTAILYLMGDSMRTNGENLFYAAPDDHTYLRQVTANVLPHYNRDLYSPTLNVEHDFGAVKLTSITSYFHSNIDARTDGDHRPPPIFDVFQQFKKNVGSEELRLSSNGDGPFHWLIGGFIQQVRSDFDQANHFDFSVITGDPADVGVDYNSDRHIQRELAGFGNASYAFGKLEVEGGLRVEHYRNTMHENLTGADAETSGTELLPKGTLSYHLDDQRMAYASITRGLQPGDIIPANAGITAFQAEHTLSYELGWKSTLLDRRLRLNVALFYTDYDNRLFHTIDGATLIEVVKNIGPSKNYGFEIDTAFRLTRELTLTGGFGVTKAKWGDITVFDPVIGADYNIKGLTAPYTPAYQGSLSLDWDHPITDNLSFGARVDVSAIGNQWWDVTDRFRQRPYQIVNLGVRLAADKGWEIGAHVFNVFDERYNTIFAAAEEIGAPFNTGGIGLPREYTAYLRLRY